MNDYKDTLVKLLTSKNRRAQIIGVVAAVPIALSTAYSYYLDKESSLDNKINRFLISLSSFGISLALSAVKPDDLIDDDKKDAP